LLAVSSLALVLLCKWDFVAGTAFSPQLGVLYVCMYDYKKTLKQFAM